MVKWLSGFLFLSLVMLSFGCQEKVELPAAPAGFVEANAAYLEFFGEPPEVKSGRGFARVAYLPLRNAPERLRAIPLYLFTEDQPVQRVLTRLVDGSLSLPDGHLQFVPFASGSKVVAEHKGGAAWDVLLTIPGDFSERELLPMVAALVETACQFGDVEQVFVTVNGAILPFMPEDGFRSQKGRIVDVAPPTLLMVAGMWEAGAEALDEILVNFDRPVTVERCEVFDASGRKVEGEYFVSAFKMSVVVHPEHAERYRDGAMLNVRWQVTDALGRSASGSADMPLERFDH